jgi:Holliday junction resolvase-like predicted endonuclease
MAEHIDLGKKGEDLACNYLLKEGYTILARNWRFLKREIDIIALDKKELVIVEVKPVTRISTRSQGIQSLETRYFFLQMQQSITYMNRILILRPG